MNLIGITGYKRSGKDTAARALLELGYTQLGFANPLKVMLRAMLADAGYEQKYIDGYLDGNMKDFTPSVLQGRTVRYALQTLGTDWGRNMIGTNLWCDLCIEKAKRHQKVVISDVRFGNEASVIQDNGGIIIRIERPGCEPDGHASEDQTEITPDATIINDSTVEHLQKMMLTYVRAYER